MKACPEDIDNERVVCYTAIDHRHQFLGVCRQVPRGHVIGPVAGLAICQHANEDTFYLFGCDADWNSVTGTWHQSLDEACHQAEFEYEGVGSTWIFIGEPAAQSCDAPALAVA